MLENTANKESLLPLLCKKKDTHEKYYNVFNKSSYQYAARCIMDIEEILGNKQYTALMLFGQYFIKSCRVHFGLGFFGI